MKKRLLQVTLPLLLIALLFAGACLFYADQILDGFIRPQIETYISQQLEAEVRIGQLVRTDSGLEVLELQIDAPQQGLLNIPRLSLDFSLTSLRHRQLEALQVFDPQIKILPGQKQKAAPTTFAVPEPLPLTIEQVTITGGHLSFTLADKPLEFHAVNFSGALRENADFTLSARFGQDEKHPLAVNGNVELRQLTRLTLNSLSWRDRQLLTTPLHIALVGPELEFAGTALGLEQFDHQELQELLIGLGQASLLPPELAFSFSAISIGVSPADKTLELEVQIDQGKLGWNELSGRFSQLKLLLKREVDSWRATGKFRGPAQTSIDFNARINDNHQLTGQAQLEIPAPAQLIAELFGGDALKVSGGLKLATQYSLDGKRFELTTEIHSQLAKQQAKDYLLTLDKLSGQGKFLLVDDREEFTLDLNLAARPFLTASGNFQRLDYSLRFDDLKALQKLLNQNLIPTQILSATELKASGQLARKMARWTGNMEMTADKIVLPELTLQQLSGRSKLQYGSAQVNFTESSFAVGIAQGEKMSAQLNGKVAGNISPQRFSLTMQQLSLAHLNYLSADEQTGLGEAGLRIQGNLSGPWPHGPISFELSGSITAEEILVGAFYAELSSYPGEFSLIGELVPEAKSLNVDHFKIDLAQLGSITTVGQLKPEQINLDSQIELIELANSYGEQIGPLLSETQPALAGLTLEGIITLTTELHWTPASWQSKGKLQLQGLDAYWNRQQLEIVAGTGSVPFVIGSGATATEEYPGEIAFDSLSVGLASLEQGTLKLAASNNRFSFLSPLLLKLANGRVVIENLNFSWLDSKPQGSVKIDIADVDLEALTAELGLPIMRGRLSANLGTLRYANRQLSTDGLAVIEVFGGRFQLRNMRYSKPFSSYPVFLTDIDFSGLDLLQATRTFDFGEMNGLLDGHIYGLKMFGKTPAAFTAAVTTRSKGKRNISVKALNNLSILSQGGISSALSRGIYRFIDFYRYRKIGFKCSLENDTFTLLGTALSGSNRYLVHGGLFPPRIDITTTTPNISFKEMLNRLGRIERAGN